MKDRFKIFDIDGDKCLVLKRDADYTESCECDECNLEETYLVEIYVNTEYTPVLKFVYFKGIIRDRFFNSIDEAKAKIFLDEIIETKNQMLGNEIAKLKVVVENENICNIWPNTYS